MFFHNLKYSLKILFKNKMLIFWTFAFPIILGTFFYLAFHDIEKSEMLNTIDIAIVENDALEQNIYLKETFSYLSSGEDPLFHIEYGTLEEAKELLEKDKIVGYMQLEESPKIVVKSNGVEETILKMVVDESLQNALLAQDVTESLLHEQTKPTNIEQIKAEALRMISEAEALVDDKTNQNMSYTMIEFYTLIAMAALYGGILGSIIINYHLANMSSIGRRSAVTPIPKLKMIFSSVIAGYITQLIGIALLLLFTIFVLHIDYGENIFLVILLAVVGSLAGLSFGIAVATLVKADENTKTGIIIAITMLGCFLSGMMGITMKYIVDTNVPFVNKLNPASMITDGFYALYYYDTLNRYWFDIMSLLLFSLILLIISFMSLRRQKYDSI